MRDADPRIWAAILAGGVGSRFWPASRPDRPKPLLALDSERPLIRDTVDRALALVDPGQLAILASSHLVPPFKSVLPDLTDESFWVEPRTRGTGPVLAWAAHRVLEADPEAVLISLHADHRIEPDQEFVRVIRRAVEIARREDILMTIAISPDRPEIGYGYIRPGERLSSEDEDLAFGVQEFIEKPDSATADEYISRGYLWNSGIFVLPVARFLHEVQAHAPEIGDLFSLLDQGKDDEFFDRTPTISVDEAIFERSQRVGALKADFLWDDLGSWEALTRSLPESEEGIWGVGEIHSVEARDCVVWSEDGPVVLFGVENLVVVHSGEITLVTSRESAPRLKQLLERLPGTLAQGGPGDRKSAEPGDRRGAEPGNRGDTRDP